MEGLEGISLIGLLNYSIPHGMNHAHNFTWGGVGGPIDPTTLDSQRGLIMHQARRSFKFFLRPRPGGPWSSVCQDLCVCICVSVCVSCHINLCLNDQAHFA